MSRRATREIKPTAASIIKKLENCNKEQTEDHDNKKGGTKGRKNKRMTTGERRNLMISLVTKQTEIFIKSTARKKGGKSPAENEMRKKLIGRKEGEKKEGRKEEKM